MIKTVTKRNGDAEVFSADKLNRWAEYAATVGGSWSEIAKNTFKRLHDGCSTEDIHETMIDVCLAKESHEYTKVAARLVKATIRKSMQRNLGIDDRSSFKEIYETMLSKGLWNKDSLPQYSEIMEDHYNQVKYTSFDYWQLKQWVDKYSIKYNNEPVETIPVASLGIAYAIFGLSKHALDFADALVKGKINLPTPALNGLRNGDFDTISCCVISSSDTTDSIGVANHIAYKMTAKKAGIGIEFTTRSKGDLVKGGRVKHLGKWPIFKAVDREVKLLTQVTRGGNATVTVLAIDPEIENILLWKSQRIDVEQRIDKLDYEFGYNDAFIKAVQKNLPWYIFSYGDAPELYDSFYTASADEYLKAVDLAVNSGLKCKKLDARKLLQSFLTVRQESGRFYDHNLTRSNTHTPFLDTIRQSNLCMEVMLPTKGYDDMLDLYMSDKSNGETAFCSLSAINVHKTSFDEYEYIAELALRAVDIMIDKAPMMTKSMRESINRRRSVGMGITGLASRLYAEGLDYDGSERSLRFVSKLAEHHYYYLLKASQKLSEESGVVADGVNLNWLPVDTKVGEYQTLDWESLRGKSRKHSVLVAHMPTESSSLMSGSTNGLYPIRSKVINKKSRKGLVQFICNDFVKGVNLTAWDISSEMLSKYYGLIQDYTDQGISCDFYVTPSRYEGGKVSMSQLMKDWIIHAKYGNKTKYYVNTNDSNGGSIQDVKRASLEEEACESCKL